jgi:hypothetical protein
MTKIQNLFCAFEFKILNLFRVSNFVFRILGEFPTEHFTILLNLAKQDCWFKGENI